MEFTFHSDDLQGFIFEDARLTGAQSSGWKLYCNNCEEVGKGVVWELQYALALVCGRAIKLKDQMNSVIKRCLWPGLPAEAVYTPASKNSAVSGGEAETEMRSCPRARCAYTVMVTPILAELVFRRGTAAIQIRRAAELLKKWLDLASYGLGLASEQELVIEAATQYGVAELRFSRTQIHGLAAFVADTRVLLETWTSFRGGWQHNLLAFRDVDSATLTDLFLAVLRVCKHASNLATLEELQNMQDLLVALCEVVAIGMESYIMFEYLPTLDGNESLVPLRGSARRKYVDDLTRLKDLENIDIAGGSRRTACMALSQSPDFESWHSHATCVRYDTEVKEAMRGCRHIALTFDGASYAGHSWNVSLAFNLEKNIACVLRPKARGIRAQQ